MQQIIQGNDTTLSIILYAQELLLPDNSGSSVLERRKVDLSLARNLSVRLIPYMRWEVVKPEVTIEGSTLQVSFPGELQKPGKWDVEITCYLPTSPGGSIYTQRTIRQMVCEVVPRNFQHGIATSDAYTVTADLFIALKGEEGKPGKNLYETYLETTTDDPKKSPAEFFESLKGAPGRSAYNSYLLTTKDTPKMSEEEWATGGWLVFAELLKRI